MLTPKQLDYIAQKIVEYLKPKDELLNTKTCAEWLGISAKALTQRARVGDIPSHKHKGLYYFSKNEVTEFYTKPRGLND